LAWWLGEAVNVIHLINCVDVWRQTAVYTIVGALLNLYKYALLQKSWSAVGCITVTVAANGNASKARMNALNTFELNFLRPRTRMWLDFWHCE
jgi:hypothetical protein